MKINSTESARLVLEDAKTALVLGNAFDLDTDTLLDAFEYTLEQVEDTEEERDEARAEMRKAEEERDKYEIERDDLKSAIDDALFQMSSADPGYDILSEARWGHKPGEESVKTEQPKPVLDESTYNAVAEAVAAPKKKQRKRKNR